MNPVIVRGVIIGEGIPKICVSLTSKSINALLEDAEALVNLSDGATRSVVDIVEWRVDHFEALENLEGTLAELRRLIGDKPLLFTYRTASEGGMGLNADHLNYIKHIKVATASGQIDLVDVELSMGEETVTQLIAHAHAHGVKVIASSHDFESTPKCEVLVAKLQKMQSLGADILKIAVMPCDTKDVLTLLEASVIMSEQYADRPIVTIAMSERGAITRVTGEVFGSAIAFGCVGNKSAPGQINASELSELLWRVHRL